MCIYLQNIIHSIIGIYKKQLHDRTNIPNIISEQIFAICVDTSHDSQYNTFIKKQMFGTYIPIIRSILYYQGINNLRFGLIRQNADKEESRSCRQL